MWENPSSNFELGTGYLHCRFSWYFLGLYYTSVENAAVAGVKNAPIRTILHEQLIKVYIAFFLECRLSSCGIPLLS
jgi:hypothetical protein